MDYFYKVLVEIQKLTFIIQQFVLIASKAKNIASMSQKSGKTQKIALNKAINNGRRAMDELGLQYDRNDKKQITRLAYILGQYLKYPSVEKAQQHRRANKLGALDQKTPEQIQQQLKQYEQQQPQQNKYDENQMKDYQRMIMRQKPKQKQQVNSIKAAAAAAPVNQKKQKIVRCECCGMTVQSQQLSLLTQTHHVNNIGMSTYLYFMTMRNLITLLLIMFFTFVLFAGATNLVSSKMYREHVTAQNIETVPTNMTYQSFLQLALGSKHFLATDFTRVTFEIQCWLGLVTIIIWGFAFIYVKKQQKLFENKVDFNTASAGDFTLEFSNIPPEVMDLCTKQNIEKVLTSYHDRVKREQKQHFEKTFSQMDMPIEVHSVNLVSWFDLEKEFDDDDDLENPLLKEYDERIKAIQQVWKKSIKEKSKTNSKLNYDMFKQLNKQYIQLKRRKKVEKMRLLKQMYGQQKQQKGDLHYSLFVTFEDTRNKQLIQRLHERQASIIYNLPCAKERVYLTVQDSRGIKHQIQVEPAPEPEDIIWANYNISRLKRWSMRFLTFFVTVVILSISFFAVYFLTDVQISISDDEQLQKSIASTLISFAISGVLFVVNFLVAQIINWLTKLERNTTYTRQQTSIGVKSIVAQLINSIIIPITINKIVKKNLYGVDGLADDVFYQSLTFAFLTPLLKVINPNYIKYLIVRWWKNRAWKRFDMSQKQLNKVNEELNFEIGSQYVEVISMFLFAVFYASLQPAVIPIIAVGLVALYFAQKFSLYRISKRPTPGNNEINTVLYIFIFLGPLLFAIGSYCWTDLLVQQKIGRIPNFLSLILAIAIFLAPYQQIIRPLIKKQKSIRIAKYSIDRFIIPSQYATCNPLTRQKAKQQFRMAKQQFLLTLKHKSRQQQQAFGRQVYSQNTYGVFSKQKHQQQVHVQQQQQQHNDEPYYEVYVNTKTTQLQQKQEGQLIKWLKLKASDPLINNIPHSIYRGQYQNQDLLVIEVNFKQYDQDSQNDEGYDKELQEELSEHQFQGYNPDKARFQHRSRQ